MRITTNKGKKSNNLKMRIKPYTAERNRSHNTSKKPPFTVKGQFRSVYTPLNACCKSMNYFVEK